MHPSDAIRGSKSGSLQGRKIVVGVSGSIAAVEAVKVIRELIRHGARVVAVTTPGASRIITPEALEFATGHRPITELTGRVEHVEHLGEGEGKTDLLLLAPATANTLSKIAQGIDDTPVTTFASMALGKGIPILVAPAMHEAMARNPFIQGNLDALRKAGVEIIPPLEEEGEAKLATPEVIAAHVMRALARGYWKGKRVLVIGGSTAEPLDEVRSITNGGSGQLAVDLATSAFHRGAEVSLWMGERRVPIPSFLPHESFQTLRGLESLLERSTSQVRSAEVILVPAALSDFAPPSRVKGKIDSAKMPKLEISLRRTEKFLPQLRRSAPRPVHLVGFKLTAGRSTAELVKIARRSLKENSLDAVVANDVSTMGSQKATIYLVRASGKPLKLSGSKATVAGGILEALAERFQ